MGVQKKVLFVPLNSPGHINSSLGIADQMREDHGWETIFLVLGATMGNSIVEHGHKLITLDEANPLEDYEIEDGEDPCEPIDELQKEREGKKKVVFSGAYKWPQVIMRSKDYLKLEPIEAFIKSIPFFEKYMIGEIIDNHESVAAAIDDVDPDLIIIDSYYIYPCIIKQKSPWVRLYSANPLALTVSKLPDGLKPCNCTGKQLFTKAIRDTIREKEPDRWNAMLEEWRTDVDRFVSALKGANKPLHDFFEKHDVPPLPLGQQAHNSPYLNLYMFPKALDYDQDDDLFGYPPKFMRCDSLTRNLGSGQNDPKVSFWARELARARSGKSKVIFFSLGSLASGNWKLMTTYIDILREDKQRLYVVSKGANGNKYELDEENMIGDDYIPQTFFLQQADLAIIHGGNNSITECMYFGVPMIVLPIFADQIDNAQRVEDLNLGRRLDVHNCSKEELLGAIEEVLADTGINTRLHEIGTQMRARQDRRKISHTLAKLVEEGDLDDKIIEEYNSKDFDEIVSKGNSV